MPENLLWALGVDGPGWGFKSGGKDCYVVPITHGMKAFLVAWCKQTVMDAALSQQGKIPPNVFRDLIADTSLDIATERYAWRGAGCLKMLQGPAGLRQLMHQLLLPKHPEITLEQVAKIIEDSVEAVNLAIEAVVKDPNWEAPL